jgi:hypothetical protein
MMMEKKKKKENNFILEEVKFKFFRFLILKPKEKLRPYEMTEGSLNSDNKISLALMEENQM